MKNAAKCDTSCELQNPVSHQNFERTLHFLRGVCLLECLFIPTAALLGRECRAGRILRKREMSLDVIDMSQDLSIQTKRHRHLTPCVGRRDVSIRTNNAFHPRVLRHCSLGIRSDLQSVKNTR